WPYVMLAARVRITTAIFSYDGTLYFGITGDYNTAPDIGVIAQGVEHGMAELLDAAGARTPKRRYRTRSSGTTRTAASSAGASRGSAGSS
ncbi:MAG: DUF1298 domain-containing protein, partial [Candidatus Dormibacteraeota bacterium]|nr:DUF1298 domain-containing protein [Candidatus Dormibacteraeota bacterium]